MRELYARVLLSLILAARWAMAPVRQLEVDRLATRRAEYDARFKALYDQAYAKEDPCPLIQLDPEKFDPRDGGRVVAHNRQEERRWRERCAKADLAAREIATQRLGERPC